VKEFVTVEDLPSKCILRYTIDKLLPIERSLAMTMSDFCGKIHEMAPPKGSTSPRINILLFGLAGATKSSFLNSVYTLLNPNQTELIQKAVAGGATDHVTVKLQKHELPKTNITLWDCWGLTTKTFKGNEMELILDGRLPNNWEMGEKLEEKADFIAQGAETAFKRQIHGVLFFIPQASLSDPNASSARQLTKQNFQSMVSKDYNPILLLTRVDEVNKQVRENPTGTYPDLISLKQKAANTLNIAGNRVLYNVNYVDEQKRNFALDKGTYKVLYQVVQFAYQKMEIMVEQSKTASPTKYNFDD